MSVSTRNVDVLIDVSPGSLSGDMAARILSPEHFRERAAEIASGISNVADELKSRLVGILTNTNDDGIGLEEVEVSFAVAVQTEAGVIITKSAASATFSVKLKLKNRPSAT